MKKAISFLILLFISFQISIAEGRQFGFQGLTGVGSYPAINNKALDGWPVLGDAGPPVIPALSDDDFAMGADSGFVYMYEYDTSSAVAENEPFVINPNDNTGNGRWLLLEIFGPVLISGTPVANDIPRFTDGSTVEGLSYAEFKAALDLESEVDFNAYDVDLTTYAGITPSANVQSLLGAATYAAMRALLDVEAGTDFYSIAAANTTFEVQLNDEAGLYAVLDDVILFLEDLADDASPTLGGNLDTAGCNVFDSIGDVTINDDITINGIISQAADSDPKIQSTDSDCADGDVGYDLDIDATATGSGAEDYDITEKVQVAGELVTIRKVNADGITNTTPLHQEYTEVTLLISDDYGTVVATGDGQGYFFVGKKLDGLDLVYCHAGVVTVGTGTGVEDFDIMIHNLTDASDMLSAALKIDEDERSSHTAATAYTIDTTEDDVVEGDLIRVDVDGVTSGADGAGLMVTLGFGWRTTP